MEPDGDGHERDEHDRDGRQRFAGAGGSNSRLPGHRRAGNGSRIRVRARMPIGREQLDQRRELGAAADAPEHDATTPRVPVPDVERRQAEQRLKKGLRPMNVADVVQADFVAEVSRDETEVGKNVAAALP